MRIEPVISIGQYNPDKDKEKYCVGKVESKKEISKMSLSFAELLKQAQSKK